MIRTTAIQAYLATTIYPLLFWRRGMGRGGRHSMKPLPLSPTRCHHPEGMRSCSPGLRGANYPGYAMGRGRNPSGLAVFSMLEPRVARASQPWAEGCNPFGIDQNVQTPGRGGDTGPYPRPDWATRPRACGSRILRLLFAGVAWLLAVAGDYRVQAGLSDAIPLGLPGQSKLHTSCAL